MSDRTASISRVPPRHVLDGFIAHLKSRKRSPHTLKAYGSDVDAFARACGSASFPRGVSPRDVRSWVELVPAVRSRQRRLTALRTFFKWARRTGLCEGNPAMEVDRLPDPRPDRQALSRPELVHFMDQVFTGVRARDAAMIALLVETGIRGDELLALKPTDVERRGAGGVVHITTTGLEPRSLAISPRAILAVEACIDAHPSGATALFLNYRGEQLGPRSLPRIVSRVGAALSELDVSPRMLRNTFERMCAAAGKSVTDRQRALGLSNEWVATLYDLARWDRPQQGARSRGPKYPKQPFWARSGPDLIGVAEGPRR